MAHYFLFCFVFFQCWGFKKNNIFSDPQRTHDLKGKIDKDMVLLKEVTSPCAKSKIKRHHMSEAPKGQALPPQGHQEHWPSGTDITEKE